GWYRARLLCFVVKDFRLRHRPVRSIARSLCVDSGAGHQFLNAIDCFVAVVDGLMVFTAHDDGLFRAGIDTKPTVDASHHIDIETCREFFDFGVWMLARLDIDTLGR